ncbi:hypothetical protein ABZ816_03195 [Actinosynnema sp. NPDC047251]|uniref:Putative membrane protein n=1 Tax=Saccharothrix espanaensis (strain ATCC 51144 / DSM 44229 / JCM 9112 / NBRC 15066 / NRRL 15764) TaxID=1179773 RepID=K0JYP6_SACES|nr:hypothetical protein [Saccharothrix espanaensis]CCH31261.1 putative membrane protein [Saccharothrix espanaensis DSM 44229]
MWEDEERLRATLRTEVDGPAPAARTDLADVLRRGRRRVLVRRAGAVAGALAVVGVVGGTVALSGLAARPAEPASGPDVTTTAPPPPWTTLDRAARQPYGTFSPAFSAPPPVDREVKAVPQCDLAFPGPEVSWLHPEPGAAVQNAWSTTTGQVAAPGRASPVHSHLFPANLAKRPDSVDGHTRWIDLTDDRGTGSVSLERGSASVPPQAAADAELWAQGNCLPPRRMVRPNGVLLQLYPVRVSEPFQSLTQELRVYAPSGEVYSISLRNFGSPDFRPQADGRAFDRTGPGRETLPLSEDGLTAIGIAVADAL